MRGTATTASKPACARVLQQIVDEPGSVPGDQMLERAGALALVATKRVTTSGRIATREREPSRTGLALEPIERAPTCRFVVGDERASLLERGRLNVPVARPVRTERMRDDADERRLAIARQAVPVIRDGHATAVESDVQAARS
jgi:hypothetical protein